MAGTQTPRRRSRLRRKVRSGPGSAPIPESARIPGASAASGRLPRRLAPRKSPTQARARETVETILEAAVDVLASRGYARTNTNQIARRAGVSIGSLYQYFPNKDAILTALLARHLESVNAAVTDSLPALADVRVPLRSAVRQLLERLRAAHEAEPRLARAVEQQAGQMPVVPETLAAHRRAYVESVAGILASRQDVREGNHVLMATLLSEVAEAVSGFLLHGDHGTFRRNEILDEGVEALCRYVERTAP